MARYDRQYDRGWGTRRPRIWGRGDAYVEHTGHDGYDADTMRGQGWDRPGIGRGTYGGDYPAFGGYPGSGREGIHYGGGGGRPHPGQPPYARRYDAQYGRGYDRAQPRHPRGGDFAREPFMPESAYLRHPEYDRPPTYHQNRWEEPGRYRIGGEPLSDEEIRHEVRQRLFQDSWLETDDIEVSVEDGVVTLRGEVDDFLQARYAWDDAWETEGVRGVISQLTVRTDQPEQGRHGDAFPQDAGGREG